MKNGWDELLDNVLDQRGKLKKVEKLLKDKNSIYDKKEVNKYLKQVCKQYDSANLELKKIFKIQDKIIKEQKSLRERIEEIEKQDGDNYFTSNRLMRAILGMDGA